MPPVFGWLASTYQLLGEFTVSGPAPPPQMLL